MSADVAVSKAKALKPLTTRQAAVLVFLSHECRTNGVAPTLNEIRIRFGWRAISTAHEFLETLEAKGYVARIHGAEQGTRLTPAAVEWIEHRRQIMANPERTDSERLDWLEDAIRTGLGPEFVEAEYSDHYCVAGSGFKFGSVGAGRLREAIDVAMDQKV